MTPGMLVLAAALVAGRGVSHATGDGAGQVWDFNVELDGKPVGHHRFSLETAGDLHTLTSEAWLTVKLLGLAVYRYRHQATEQWRGDCLAALVSSTDDDGRQLAVRSEAQGESYVITAPPGTPSTQGCLMSYAYWNPTMLTQTRLLNAQTGRVDTVRITALGAGTIEVHGTSRAAMRWRISGPETPVDVWYSERGAWIGLDATVRGNRTLSYRLP